MKKLVLTEQQYMDMGALLMVMGLAEGMKANREILKVFLDKALPAVNEEQDPLKKLAKAEILHNILTEMANSDDTLDFFKSCLGGKPLQSSITFEDLIQSGAKNIGDNMFEFPTQTSFKENMTAIITAMEAAQAGA